MSNHSHTFDDEFLYSKIKSTAASSVQLSDSARAGQVPVSDGEGGASWGAAIPGTFVATDPDNDGHVTLQFVEGD